MEAPTLIHGDAFEQSPVSAELILTDPPYGVTSNAWDLSLDMEKFWKMAQGTNTIILTASQPFTARVVSSNEKWFKHEWIWIKNRGSNFANTVREPFKEHESILVFCSRKRWKYNRIMQERTGAGAARVEY